MSSESQNKNNSPILNLESLTKQYDTLLIQYNQVQTDYINYLQKNPSTIQAGSTTTQVNQELTSIPNNTFWGTSGISSSNVSTVEQCAALCSSTPGCSGATYNDTKTTQNNCWLRSGNGPIVSGTTNQYAIITQSKEYLLTLQTLNSQLISVNIQIIQLMQNNKTIFLSEDDDKNSKYNVLVQNNSKLEEERNDILVQLGQFQSINEKQSQGELIVTKNYYNYILLLIVVLICVFILSKIYVGSSNGNAEDIINILSIIFFTFIICVVVFIIYYYFHNRI
jgi:NADH:ubiquinone oxidoreductase subunit 3 (subunit A)